MKKLLACSLAALLLAGCTADPPAPTEPAVEATAPATEEIVITHESLELLEFDYEDVYAAAPMGDDLLLFCNTDKTTLVKISGRNHKELASVDTGCPISPDFRAVQIGKDGVCYATDDEYIFLNENLEETERVSLPDAWGRGAVSADQQTIYYSTGSALWAYSRETGLHRLLRETMHTGLALESLELNDSVLVCQLFDHRAVPTTLFYSAATGELLGSYEDSIHLSSAGKTWLAKTNSGHRNQIVFGGDLDPRVVTDYDTFSDVTLVSGGILIHSPAAIRYLNLTHSTEVTLALDKDALVMNAWNADGILWIALDDGRLLRWELEDAEPQAISCLAPYYSRENPDTEGLAVLETTITRLEETYGVQIHIAEDAVAVQPDGVVLHSEFQVEPLTEALTELELALSPFDPGFLEKTGTVHICLVRSLESDGCIQFWADGDAYIVLEMGGNLQRSFFHGMGHVIDAKVLTECTAFDDWKYQNPGDFSHLYSYTAEADTGAYPGAFADVLGMVSPVEDRAFVFAAAMTADMADTFKSETMQEKLSTLCSGIRKAFRLQDAEETFPWEQYLAK